MQASASRDLPTSAQEALQFCPSRSLHWCETIFGAFCCGLFDPFCVQVPETKCRKEPSEKCWDEPVQKCQQVPEEKCWQVGEVKYWEEGCILDTHCTGSSPEVLEWAQGTLHPENSKLVKILSLIFCKKKLVLNFHFFIRSGSRGKCACMQPRKQSMQRPAAIQRSGDQFYGRTWVWSPVICVGCSLMLLWCAITTLDIWYKYIHDMVG